MYHFRVLAGYLANSSCVVCGLETAFGCDSTKMLCTKMELNSKKLLAPEPSNRIRSFEYSHSPTFYRLATADLQPDFVANVAVHTCYNQDTCAAGTE